ncbi:TPR repeat-containing protein [Sulfurihydrogenibium sp. YO3AOP1]|uniref:tetratricopeptide repeat protein n=1 Tax=Sulfurihydrogenibium sp. (strain YO3AOP1) TaxID=436114 RepID=UPI0001723E81|nr:tetratricopeptide repeat protein [Sulfurihydrogenibium sp. YO3AOP1]ACD66945.1 TPR repeat-containing protein [Sulfurihydrogenibium sp. YO3AOP1]
MRTDEFLKKASKEIEETEKKDINPLVGIVKEEKKSIKFKIIVILVILSYIVIGYLFYDYLKNRKSEIKIVEDFINSDVLINELNEKLKNIDIAINNEIKTDEELIKSIQEQSLNLPPINQVVKQPINLPPINLPQPQTQEAKNSVQTPITSKYDFFKNKAIEYENVGNYRYAIFFYLRAFAENQSDYELKYKIATLYYKLGQIPLAIQSAKDALLIKEDYMPAIEFLISLYNSGYEIDGLENILKKALEKYPNDRNIILALAKIYQKNNNTTEYQKLMEKLQSSK